VVLGEEPRGERGLHGAGDGGEDRAEGATGPFAGEGREARGGLADELSSQADDEEDEGPMHGEAVESARAGRRGAARISRPAEARRPGMP
jgi:hypothetical protein